MRIKDVGSLAKKFVQRAQGAGGDYKSGVEQAAGDWESATKAAEQSYRDGVTAAAADGRFGRGVAAAGGAKYQQRASTLGAQRYPTGVAASEGEWAKGTAPYLQALSSMTLTPRRPKGDPANMQRANDVATRLRAMRVAK